jgi:mRNA interferase RelE/StbE
VNKENLSHQLVPTPRFIKQFSKFDKFIQRKIQKYMEAVVKVGANPRAKGKGLTANHSGLWRYRIGDYRVTVDIDDDQLIVLALETAHRKDVYRN